MIIDINKDIFKDQDKEELPNIISASYMEDMQRKCREVCKRNIEGKTVSELLADVKRILEALTKEDFEEHIKRVSERVERLKKSGRNSTYLYFIEYQTKENYINCYDFICDYVLGFYITAAEELPELKEAITAIEAEINKKILLWYPEATPEEWQEYYKLYEGKKEPEELKPVKVEKILYPVDKVNNKLWKLPLLDQNEVLEIMTGRKDKQDINIIVSLDFENENQELSKELTEYDKLVYIAVSSLYNAGNKCMSLSMIYNVMGNTGRPSNKQLEKIDKSLQKMRRTIFKLNNYQEVNARFKYGKAVYDESLLSFRGLEAKINGFPCRVIEVSSMPPLLRFSSSRNQLTTINKKLLEDPLKKVDENISLKFYLLGYISNCKSNNKLQRKLLFTTLCKECGAVNRLQKNRLKEKINKIMSFYQQEDFIKSFYFDNGYNLCFNF